jgi:hypothetical protein
MTGNSIKEIHRRSYRSPIKKDGITSASEIALGLKAINVATLNNVNISRKITSRLATHIIVFGILNRRSIFTYPV